MVRSGPARLFARRTPVTVHPLLSSPNPKTRAAHAALYARHAAELRDFAKARTGSRADAEDVVQDVFTRAWELACERPGLPPPPLTWLREEVRKQAVLVRTRRAMERPMPLRAR